MLALTLRPDVTQKIMKAVARAGRHEVGGILMAEHIGINSFAIAELTIHKQGAFASFVRRIEDALGHLTSFFLRTNHDYRRFNYIGEWHSHPIFELEPSPQDDASMFEIILDTAVGAKFTILLLVKLDVHGRLLAKGHVYLPDGTRHLCDLTYAT
jgi:Prokaryotic homologs of the JAB domain